MLQPFSHTSIWNMPIGSNAKYVHARLEPSLGVSIDEDYIVLMPDETPITVYQNNAGWDPEKDRCIIEGDSLFSVPFPKSWMITSENWEGPTPNAGLAALLPDGRTILQSQPFAKCRPDIATSGEYQLINTVDIYGDGIYGSHGGSGLSAIGGTLRLHELTPTSGPIRHALKINLFANKNIYYDRPTRGYRWPARQSDGYAASAYYKDRTYESVPACRMGALLAIPPSITVESLELETRPAATIAQALQDYGGYVADDTAWDVFTFCIEWSPEGRFREVFKENWGFDCFQVNADTPWVRDMQKIFSVLHVVDNNAPNTIGGGGEPRVPLAAPIYPPEM